MKTELVHALTQTFEGHAQQTDGSVEFWLARDLQQLLGYTKWDNFLNVVSKAKTACDVSGHEVADHFADVGKMVDLGSCSQRKSASRGAAKVHSLAASAPGEVRSRVNHQHCLPEPPTGATEEGEPDDRRVAITHRQASSFCRPLRGLGSSLVRSGFLGLTPPGYELAPRSGLKKVRQ